MIKIDKLHKGGLSIFRDTQAFAYGTDSVLLSDFASKKKAADICDLCSGTGIVPLLMSVGNNSRFCCVEIDSSSAELCEKSVEINGLEERFSVICGDVKNIKNLLPYGSFDLVTANPPYFTEGSGLKAEGSRGDARTDNLCSVADICKAAKHLCRGGGRLCVVYRTERLVDIICSMRENGFEPKRLLLVSSRKNQAPYLCLVEGKKGAKPGITVEEPLIIMDEDDKYTPRVAEIYGRKD